MVEISLSFEELKIISRHMGDAIYCMQNNEEICEFWGNLEETKKIHKKLIECMVRNINMEVFQKDVEHNNCD